MRDLKRYSFVEWLHLLPVSDAWKMLRNDIWQYFYNKKSVIGLEEFLLEVTGQHVGLVVAFEQPWALNWQLSLAAKNVPGLQMLVFDNSREDSMRERIAEVCRSHGVAYLSLPAGKTRHVNRSHGLAMNWIYQNVVLRLHPESFMFIDHDMIPVLPNPYPAQLAAQPIFGRYNSAKPWSWQLWAGYCAFRFEYVQGRNINFMYDFGNDLDTGGRNWASVYRHFNPASLNMAAHEFVPVIDPVAGDEAMVEMVDRSWFHIGGISYNNTFQKKSELCEHLAAALEHGVSWTDLCPAMKADVPVEV